MNYRVLEKILGQIQVPELSKTIFLATNQAFVQFYNESQKLGVNCSTDLKK